MFVPPTTKEPTLSSTLSLVKYRFVEPSDKSSVVLLIKKVFTAPSTISSESNSEKSIAIFKRFPASSYDFVIPTPSVIRFATLSSTLSLVKYRFVPSDKSVVDFDPNNASTLL